MFGNKAVPLQNQNTGLTKQNNKPAALIDLSIVIQEVKTKQLSYYM